MLAYARTRAIVSARLPRAIPPGTLDGRSRRALRGLSLVELMIALALGLFLIGGILQILASSRATYRLAESTARAQESGRYALHILSREMRPSRSTACRDISEEEVAGLTDSVKACMLLATPDSCSGEPRIGTATPLGYTIDLPSTPAGTSPTSSASVAAAALTGLPGPGSCDANDASARCQVAARWLRGDVLVSWGVFGEGLYTVTPASGNPGTGPVTLIGAVDSAAITAANFRGGHLAMITDCDTSDIFTISDAATTNPLTSLHHTARADGGPNRTASLLTLKKETSASNPRARVFPFDLSASFICCVDQNTGDHRTGTAVNSCNTSPAQYRPALCRWSASLGSTQVLVPDVADMSIRYFIRTSALPLSAADITDWSRVTSIQVSLLVTGGDEMVKSASGLPGSGATVGELGYGLPADRRLYERFETTIAIRSSAPSP